MTKLSIVIVNYNTKEFLSDCLNNVDNTYQGAEVIVVDNSSTDGSSELVSSEFPHVHLIKTENKGLAAGSNLGYKASHGDYLLYLGTDAFPEKGTIDGMLSYMDGHADVGIATCKLVLRNGFLDMDAHRGFPTPWASITHFLKINKVFPKSKLFNRYFMGYEDMNTPHEIDLCVSHFMLIKRSIFEDIGLWDEDFFVYGEDVDFCYRVKQKGWKIMYLPKFKAVHFKGTSVGIRKETADISKASDDTKSMMRKSTTQAMKLFYEKHYKKTYPSWVTNIVLFGINTLSKLRS